MCIHNKYNSTNINNTMLHKFLLLHSMYIIHVVYNLKNIYYYYYYYYITSVKRDVGVLRLPQKSMFYFNSYFYWNMRQTSWS